MIFRRRVLFDKLRKLSQVMDATELQAMAKRIDNAGADRFAASWEIAILSSLLSLGKLEYEKSLHDGKKPDIHLDTNSKLVIVADITCISDFGLDEQNPIDALSKEIERVKSKLGYPLGGSQLEVGNLREKSSRGEKTKLKIPHKRDIPKFVDNYIKPELQKCRKIGVAHIEIDQPGMKLKLDVNAGRSPYNSISHAAYNSPTSLTQNPLYRALKSKAKQLKGYTGTKGIVACDGSTNALQAEANASNQFSNRDIVVEFLRQHKSIDFVLCIKVEETVPHFMSSHKIERQLRYMLECQSGCDQTPTLDELFRSMAENMPTPIRSAINGSYRAREQRNVWGKHGAYQMSGGENRMELKMSSRELIEVLAGRLDHQKMNDMHRWTIPGQPADNGSMINPFELALQQGRLPVVTKIERDPADDDDWFIIEFGERDPAIANFGSLITDQNENSES